MQNLKFVFLFLTFIIFLCLKVVCYRQYCRFVFQCLSMAARISYLFLPRSIEPVNWSSLLLWHLEQLFPKSNRTPLITWTDYMSFDLNIPVPTMFSSRMVAIADQEIIKSLVPSPHSILSSNYCIFTLSSQIGQADRIFFPQREKSNTRVHALKARGATLQRFECNLHQHHPACSLLKDLLVEPW